MASTLEHMENALKALTEHTTKSKSARSELECAIAHYKIEQEIEQETKDSLPQHLFNTFVKDSTHYQ